MLANPLLNLNPFSLNYFKFCELMFDEIQVDQETREIIKDCFIKRLVMVHDCSKSSMFYNCMDNLEKECIDMVNLVFELKQ
jgi:hypothetical protein